MTIKLEGCNLGAKHKHLNNLVTQSSENYRFDKVDLADGDVVNLIKIDIASRNKNVDYILKVLVCEDLLYVSRAINQCPWLVAEANYKHIINPEYLHHKLFPQMTSKAAIKLTKYIKLNLKDSERAEQFYNYYEEDPKKAAEWLPHCSVDFINSRINKHISHVDITLLKRLCERSITVLEVFIKNNNYSIKEALQATIFLMKHDLQKYLNIVEKQPQYSIPSFNKNATELLMKQASDRIIKNFKTYCNHVDIFTFLKYLKKANIKPFLFNIFKEKDICKRNFCFHFEALTTFITSMPDDDRLEFVTQVLIDKVYVDYKCSLPKPLKCSMENFVQFTCQYKYIYIYDHFWYRYTPFKIAFTKIQELINNQTPSDELNSMYHTLIIAAGDSIDNLKYILDYYIKNHKNANQLIKYTFINNLISHNTFHKFDEDMWNNLEETFMNDILNEINEEIKIDECKTQICVEAIIIYYTLHMKKVPTIIENKFKFNTLKSYQKKLNKEENDILFTYLYNTILRKLNSHSSSTKEEFIEKTKLLNEALDLLIDWTKDLGNYPAVVNAIKDLININEQNSWNVDFANIYNKKKSWRKVLFNESLKMHPSQLVLINALKHDPSLLERYQAKVENVYFSNNIFLKQYHKKIKMYWSESLAKQLIHKYSDQLKNIKCNKAAIRALCILLPKEDLQILLNEYAPKEDKIDWNNSNEFTLIIQQNLAKIMHIARPQPSPKLILNYSKGDYLPYALPSLYAIFYNLNLSDSQHFIPMLLDTKVSLQKHGIRLAFNKLPPEEVKNILSKVLDANKNAVIRHIAFELTFKLLCKEKDPERSQAIWYIMETFLDNLSNKENDAIYELLLKVEEVPISVRPSYFMKSYNILKSYIASDNSQYEKYKYSFETCFISYARNIIDQLCPEFITKILLEFIDKDFIKMKYIDSKLEVMSSYLLWSNDEESQMEKYNVLMVPLIQKCLKHWDDTTDDKKYVVRLNLESLLDILRKDIKEYVFDKNKILPTKLFEIINTELMKALDYPSSYLLLTKWQLTVDFIRTLDKHDGDDWNKACVTLAPEFSKVCINNIIDHCEKYFTNIYVLYAKALYSCFKNFVSNNAIHIMLKSMLHSEKRVQVYLAVLKLIQYFNSNDSSSDETVKDIEELFKTISDHPSAEVQIHFYHCRNIHLSTISETIFINRMKEIHDVSVTK